MSVKIVKAPAGGRSMTRGELEEFLAGKLILRIATVNSRGDPEIQPVWYQYSNGKMYLMTGHDSRKVRNIRHKKTVYFSVDTEIVPYRGAKGRGTATILTDKNRAATIAEEISVRYLGNAEHPMAKRFTNAVREGRDVVIEIVPEYFSVWDYSNLKM
jgi:nitroimidazol reductase NimA-like FMN-containing flavoprotein (pyridoxamine 5'-phosphate oxidase superfamily)